MIAFASFLIPIAYAPYLWTGSSMLKWMVVALLSAACCNWRALLIIPFIWWGAQDYDAAAKWTILALAFSAGFNLDMRDVVRGFGIGIGCNSVLAVAQSFGLDYLTQVASPAGTFLNKNLLAEAACLVIVAAAAYRIWWVMLISTPALVLTQGRAALVATFVGLIASFASWRWRVYLLIAAAMLVFVVPLNMNTLVERVAIWKETATQLTVWGHGIGSWSSSSIDDITTRSYYMHNDWLQLMYEVGAWSLIVFLVLVHTLGGFTLALILLATFGFPLHEPASGFLSAAMLGHLCCHHLGTFRDGSRSALRDWVGQGLLWRHPPRPKLVPLGPTHSARPGTLAHEHVTQC